MRYVYQSILFVLLTCLSIQVSALSNEEMYKALRKTQQDLGGWTVTGQNKWNDRNYISDIDTNPKSSSHQFYFLSIGQPTTDTGVVLTSVSRELYKQVTELSNKGSEIVLTHYSRDVIPKYLPVVLGEKKMQDAIETMQELTDVDVTITPVKDNTQFVIQARFKGRNTSNSTTFYRNLYKFFQELLGFHSVFEDKQNWAVYNYNKMVDKTKFTSFNETNTVKVGSITVDIAGEQLLQDVLATSLLEADKAGPLHWSYWYKTFQKEIWAKDAEFVSAIQVPYGNDLTSENKAKLIAELTTTAKNNMPKGYSDVRVTDKTGSEPYLQVAYIYDLSRGVKGQRLEDHYDNFLSNDEEYFNKLWQVSAKYNKSLTKKIIIDFHTFVYKVLEWDLAEEDSADVAGTQGYWEFEYNEIDYDVVNYGDKFLLSFSMSFSDDWSVEELQENNKAFLASLSSKERLNADNIVVANYNDDPMFMWVQYWYEYSNHDEEDWNKIYTKFVEDKSVDLYNKFMEAQGAQ